MFFLMQHRFNYFSYIYIYIYTSYISNMCVLEECQLRASSKSVLQKCQANISNNSVTQKCPASAFHEWVFNTSVKKVCLKKGFATKQSCKPTGKKRKTHFPLTDVQAFGFMGFILLCCLSLSLSCYPSICGPAVHRSTVPVAVLVFCRPFQVRTDMSDMFV